MHEHQQQPTTSHSQNYQPSFVPLIRKYESFSTTVEPPRGLCATSDLHCNDCGRPKTSFYEPPAIFINILPQNDLDVCKILSLPFTGSAADHVQELYISSDLHCNDCDRPHMSYHKSPAILITILPQKYLERYKILSSPFTDPAADPLDKLCSVSDLQPDDRGRLFTHRCLPPAIFMTVASQYHSEPWVLTPFPPHVTMMIPRWLTTLPNSLIFESSHEGSISMSIFSESPQCSVCTLVNSDKIQLLTSEFYSSCSLSLSHSQSTHMLFGLL
jgi:hypothetical protein